MRKWWLIMWSLIFCAAPSTVSGQSITVVGRDQIILQIDGLETDETFEYEPGSNETRPRLRLDNVIIALSYTDSISVGSSSGLTPLNRPGRQSTSRPTFEAISISKSPDITSPAFRLSAANQQSYARATIHVVQPTGYFRIELEDVTVGGIRTAMGEPGKMVETVELNFNKIEWDYQDAGERQTGSVAGSHGTSDQRRSRAEWDVEQNRGG